MLRYHKQLDVRPLKNPRHRTADPFCRLRVPKYQKAFEAFFFAALLALYYAVLLERSLAGITATETILIIFFAAFAVDELSSIRDSSLLFYLAEFWSWLDVLLIFIGAVSLAMPSLTRSLTLD